MAQLADRIGSRRRIVACGCVCACAAVLAPARALADGTDPGWPGSVLHVAVAGRRVARRRLTIVATGTNEPQGVPTLYGLRVFAVEPRLGPCKRSYANELTIAADNTGALQLTLVNGLSEGLSGPFTVSVPFTPRGAGGLLICAYTLSSTDAAGDDADVAWASDEVRVTSTPPPTPGSKAPPKPAIFTPPVVSRSGGRLLCASGTWSGNPTSYRYRWTAAHATTAVGRTSTLLITPALRGREVECSVTATNPAGSATATSRPFSVARRGRQATAAGPARSA